MFTMWSPLDVIKYKVPDYLFVLKIVIVKERRAFSHVKGDSDMGMTLQNIQFLRFMLAGGTAALANILSKLVLEEFLPYDISIILAYLVGVSVAFVANIGFVFESQKHHRKKELIKFFIYNIAMIPCVLYITSACDGILNQYFENSDAYLVSHIVGVSSPIFISFLFHKHITFGGYR